MNQLTIVEQNNQSLIFEGQHEVMVLLKGDVNFDFKGDFLARANDVSKILRYSQAIDFVNLVKSKYVYKVKNSDLAKSQNRKLNNAGETFVSSFGLNQGLSNSTMPKAEPFQDWLFEDALPSIQKHGAYLTPNTIENVLNDPDFGIELLTTLKKERAEKESLRLQNEKKDKLIEEQKPNVIYAEAVKTSKDNVLVKDLASVLKQNGFDIGEKRLFIWLRENGFLCKKKGEMWNMPTQRSLDLGVIEVKHGLRTGSEGEMKPTRTPKITGKGQIYFINKLTLVTA